MRQSHIAIIGAPWTSAQTAAASLLYRTRP